MISPKTEDNTIQFHVFIPKQFESMIVKNSEPGSHKIAKTLFKYLLEEDGEYQDVHVHFDVAMNFLNISLPEIYAIRAKDDFLKLLKINYNHDAVSLIILAALIEAYNLHICHSSNGVIEVKNV